MESLLLLLLAAQRGDPKAREILRRLVEIGQHVLAGGSVLAEDASKLAAGRPLLQ